MSVQTEPHAVRPIGQTHTPAAHVCVAGQTLLQAPQFIASSRGSMHAREQAMNGAPHLMLHIPSSQKSPGAQRPKQKPQLFGSCLVSTQTPLHTVKVQGTTGAPPRPNVPATPVPPRPN